MNFIQRIKNVFCAPPQLICGGDGVIEIIVSNKVCGVIRYRRPTSDEKLDYLYQLQKGIGTELQLKEIQSANDKSKKCHEIMVRDLSIPFAEKIFLGSELFRDDHGKTIDNQPLNKQFDTLKTYWSHALVDMVAIAYATEGVVKKKR